MTRRDFLRLMAAAGFVTVLPADIVRAVDKTEPHRKQWAMAIDILACRDGCADCISACHRVHNVPDIPDARRQVRWIWASPFEDLFPDDAGYKLRGRQVMALCNHCERPPCVSVCPTKATFRRDDGIVMMDYHRCIGCRYCMAACPFGARSFNWQDPRPYIKNIDPGYPTRTKGVVEKCNFCQERLAKNLLPACVEACRERAVVFGDLNDERSRLRLLLSYRQAMQRKPQLGTHPKVFYLA